MDGKVFFLQGHTGTAKTYFLSLLRHIVKAQGMLVEIYATTGIVASLYKNFCILYSSFNIGVEHKDASERHARLSKYGPR